MSSIADGYLELVQEYIDHRDTLISRQFDIQSQIHDILDEIQGLPDMPRSIDNWINSLPDLDKKGFGLDTFNRHVKFNRAYDKLMEKSEENLTQIKICEIDRLINLINSSLVLSDKDSSS